MNIFVTKLKLCLVRKSCKFKHNLPIVIISKSGRSSNLLTKLHQNG